MASCPSVPALPCLAELEGKLGHSLAEGSARGCHWALWVNSPENQRFVLSVLVPMSWCLSVSREVAELYVLPPAVSELRGGLLLRGSQVCGLRALDWQEDGEGTSDKIYLPPSKLFFSFL